MEVNGQLHTPATLVPGKDPRYPLNRRLGGSQCRSGRCKREISSAPAGLEPRAVHEIIPSGIRLLLWTWCWNFRFHKRLAFFWQAEQPSASQEAPCTVPLNLAWSREGGSSPWNWPLLHRIGWKRFSSRRHVLCILEFLWLIILIFEPVCVLQKKKIH
jgi:hypothetical protein